MQETKMLKYIEHVIENRPDDWLNLTTHRLDIYNEALAKTEFLEAFNDLYHATNFKTEALSNLPTAYDYIRLGHPLSCVLEWAVGHLNGLKPEHVISFSSQTLPILSILRKNVFDNKQTRIVYTSHLPEIFKSDLLKTVYGYTFELQQVENIADISKFKGSTIYISQKENIGPVDLNPNIDFYVSGYSPIGSILLVNGITNADYISEIQHVRRRETIAMTPANCLIALKSLTTQSAFQHRNNATEANKKVVLHAIKDITATTTKPLVASSGLSIQYAILMGLIDDAVEHHKGKPIKIIVPPNCYGGTNDQARRVAACLENVDIVDLPVDGDNDMVKSIDRVLTTIANQDAIPYIIAEIPTNPRVEVPDLSQLKAVLSKARKTTNGDHAIAPVFLLDQTFCPNVQFLGENDLLSAVKTISFASGSKFPSGGKCTAGYCVGNAKTEGLMKTIEKHVLLCDNEATSFQYEILAMQLPSMTQRITDAYINTRDFVSFIQNTLPEAKINFVSKTLAKQGFTPSVFSLDLPTKGNTPEEKEANKRALNLKLINLMITKIQNESKYCVSYGQLKGCYWTIPATSTQGTTKEDDKDYIIRASLSPNLDLELHKDVFLEFVKSEF